MTVRETVRSVSDERWRVAALAGLASVPFTVAASWSEVVEPSVVVGGNVSGWALVLAGLAVGYYYADRPGTSAAAGVRTGLAGSLGVAVVHLANVATTLPPPSVEAAVFVVLGAPLALAIGVALAVFVCAVAAAAGGWLARRVSRIRPADAGG